MVVVGVGVWVVSESVGDGVDARIHPARAAVAVAAHVVVEDLTVERAGGKEFEDGEVEVVAVLEGAVGDVVGIVIGGFLEVGGDGLEGWAGDVVAGRVVCERGAGWR